MKHDGHCTFVYPGLALGNGGSPAESSSDLQPSVMDVTASVSTVLIDSGTSGTAPWARPTADRLESCFFV
jgi:hypothetical protein